MAIVSFNPAVLVCDRHARAWPADPGKEPDPAEYGPLSEALTTAFPFDAHVQACSLPTVPHRLRSGAVTSRPRMVAAIFDVDTPGHVPITPEWWAQEEPKLRALTRARGRCYIFSTKNGLRIVYGLQPVELSPEPATGCHPQRWKASYSAWCDDLETFGIKADRSCDDPWRLTRLPRVNRDGEDVVPQYEIGEPDRLAAWPVGLLPADDPRCLPPPPRAVPAALAAPVPEERLLEAATALADAWPERGRHGASLRLCGTLAGLGWSEEAIADFVDAVTGGTDPEKRARQARDACDRAARGESLAGWPTVAEHLATGRDGVHDPNRDAVAEAAVLVARRALGDPPPEETWAGAVAIIKAEAPTVREVVAGLLGPAPPADAEAAPDPAELAAAAGVPVSQDLAAAFAAWCDWGAEQWVALRAAGGKEAAAPTPLFMTSRQLHAMNHPPPEWLVRGLVTRRGVGAISGEPKTSKSWMAIGVGLAVSAGTTALGKFAVDKPGRVAYYFSEDDAGSIANRQRALAKGAGIACDDWMDRFAVQPRGRALDLTQDLHCVILIGSVRLSFPDGVDLLILDPLSDLHSGEEDKRDSMAPLMQRLRAIAQILDCAIVFVHHTTKAGADTKQRRRGQRMRGSGAIHGAVDFGLYLDLDERADNKTVCTVEGETKTGKSAGEFGLTLTLIDGADGYAIDGRWSVGAPAAHAAPKGEAAADEKVAVVCQRLFDHGHPLTRDDLRRKIGGAADVLAKAIVFATEAGWVTQRMNGGRPAGFELTDAGREYVRSGRAPSASAALPPAPAGGVSGFLAQLAKTPASTGSE